MMKLISWNVNGFRAVLKKGFEDFFGRVNADIFCIQETKMQQGQAEVHYDGYLQYWNSAEKKGYSGTAVFTKYEPIHVTYDIGHDIHDKEGRVITLEFEKFYLINVYTPNSQRELVRLDYRMQWEEDFKAYLENLDRKKPLIVCGDMNVAHQEIDLRHPATNHKNAGFTDEEREKMSELLEDGFLDTFRYLYPNQTDAYTWWSYMNHARQNNAGWRIDYFLTSKRMREQLIDHKIHAEVMGSDHCPIELDLKN